MSAATRFMAGLILVILPTIAFGGYFLLSALIDPHSGYLENPMRQDLFRAGHAHAGVITLLSLLAQLFVDATALGRLQWLVRIGVPLAGILMSAGFFFSILPPSAARPGPMLALVYVGMALLIVSVLTLGVGLLRRR